MRGCRSADRKRGQRRGPRKNKVKTRQKVSNNFRHFPTFSAQVKKRAKILKKCQEYFRHFFRTGQKFSRTFWWALSRSYRAPKPEKYKGTLKSIQKVTLGCRAYSNEKRLPRSNSKVGKTKGEAFLELLIYLFFVAIGSTPEPLLGPLLDTFDVFELGEALLLTVGAFFAYS